MAENDWDADNFEPITFTPAAVGSSRWEGEDEDEEVKDSWEDFAEEEKSNKENESKEESKEESKVQLSKVKKKKSLKDVVAEKEEKKKQELEKRKQLEESSIAVTELTTEEILEEKLRQQRLQEESDLELVKETFGTSNDVKYGLESMNPMSKEDFDAFRKALLETVSKHERSPCYVAFLEDFFRDLCLNLEADDLKKLGNTLHVLANEKVKAAKASSKGKKKGAKSKASLYVGKPGDYDYGGEYEANEFDDFM